MRSFIANRPPSTKPVVAKILCRPFQNHAFGGLEVLLGRLGSSWRGVGASWGGLEVLFLRNLLPTQRPNEA